MKRRLLSFIMICILGVSTLVYAGTQTTSIVGSNIDGVLSEWSAEEIDGVLCIEDFESMDSELLSSILQNRQLACPYCSNGRISISYDTWQDYEPQFSPHGCNLKVFPHTMRWYVDDRTTECDNCSYSDTQIIRIDYGHWCTPN